MKSEYIDHMGGDDRVVDAARVSFSKIADNYTEEQNARLIKYLANHNHFTPFTHPVITLRETVPIFVARQRFKHTVGFTYNEESRRYVDDSPEFFVPDKWRGRADNKKQGSSDEEIGEGLKYLASPLETGMGADFDEEGLYVSEFYHISLKLYQKMLKDGIAPEQARMVLPQAMYTSYYVTGSLAAWARAYKLRIDPHAQYEIRVLADQWDQIIRPLFPISWPSLVD
tara:strand:+ start:4253 stop:4933 length:681 start_codon:yes stop_codon:yes gene_type:complete